MLRAVIGIVVVATMVGVMMPARSVKAGSSDTNASPAAAAAEPWFAEDGSTAGGARASRSNDNVGSEVRLTRHGDGHFYADVEVNGTNVEFMIDTGATGIALTEEDARRAGVRLVDDQRSYVGEGAGGALTGQRVTLDQVRLGPRSSTSMSAVVIDGASTNLLGQTFLSQFGEVTVRGDVMTLR